MLSIVLKIFGAALIVMGIATFMVPDVFTPFYGVELPTERSKSVIRGLIGGSEVGLGLVQIMHIRFKLHAPTLGVLVLFLLGGIASARVASMAAYSGWSTAGIVELILETSAMAIVWFALQRDTNGLVGK